jgi:hypothetical protein
MPNIQLTLWRHKLKDFSFETNEPRRTTEEIEYEIMRHIEKSDYNSLEDFITVLKAIADEEKTVRFTWYIRTIQAILKHSVTPEKDAVEWVERGFSKGSQTTAKIALDNHMWRLYDAVSIDEKKQVNEFIKEVLHSFQKKRIRRPLDVKTFSEWFYPKIGKHAIDFDECFYPLMVNNDREASGHEVWQSYERLLLSIAERAQGVGHWRKKDWDSIFVRIMRVDLRHEQTSNVQGWCDILVKALGHDMFSSLAKEELDFANTPMGHQERGAILARQMLRTSVDAPTEKRFKKTL